MSETMTTTGNESDPPFDFTPTEEWIDEFTKQCTLEMRPKLKRYAMRRLQGIGKFGGHADEDAAQEMVQNVLGDTLMGIVSWDPAKKTLQQHLEDTIQFRTRHARKRAKKYPHHRIDAFDPVSEKQAPRVELEAALDREHNEGGVESALCAREVTEQLRELAAKDRTALVFVDAIVAGARSRADIMEFGEMSLKTYRNVRGRLRRLVEKLDVQANVSLRA
jgi:hypothetical protein